MLRRVAAELRKIGDAIWVIERPMVVFGALDMGTRMTVIRLADGGLFLHSPTPIDDATRAAVDALGPVRCIGAPNCVHHLYVGPWKDAHPAALLLGAPGLDTKRRDLRFDAILDDAPHPSYAASVDHVLLGGAPYMNEIAFLQRLSRTLLLTDAAFRPTPASTRGVRIWTKLTAVRDGFGPNALVRWLIRDRRAMRASIDRVLGWDFDRVTVTHGEVLESGGRDALARAYAWL
jgi:hypothetical protein